MSTLTVKEFCYRPPQNKASHESNTLFSVVITNNLEVFPVFPSSKKHSIKQQFPHGWTLLRIASLLHPEEDITLFLIQKTINLSLSSNNSSTALSRSPCLTVAELTELLLLLKNATLIANRSTADPLCTTCKHSHAEWMKILMKNVDIYLRTLKLNQMTLL